MLHTNYQCHRLIGSGEDFESILTIVGHVCRACHVTPDYLSKHLFSQPQETTRNLAQWLLRVEIYDIVIL